MQAPIYLDYAATSPLDSRVLEKMLPYLTEVYGNPSSTHSLGRKAKVAIETARKHLAKLINCSPNEIIFTSGGTEADNLAIFGAIRKHNIKHIIASPLEHHAVLHALEAIETEGLAQVYYLDLLENHSIDLMHLTALLSQYPSSLVTIMHGNNEIGVINPIAQIKEICTRYNALFHSDTVQTISHIKFDFGQNHIPDFITASSHKFYGPKGVGFLVARQPLSAIIYGGTQERSLRAGTEDVASIVGMVEAFSLAYEELEVRENHLNKLKSYFISAIKTHITGAIFNQPDNGMSNIVSLTIPRADLSDTLLFHLDLNGIAVSGGSACASGSLQGSHVLRNINGNRNVFPTIRFSFGKDTTTAELDKVISVLRKL